MYPSKERYQKDFSVKLPPTPGQGDEAEREEGDGLAAAAVSKEAFKRDFVAKLEAMYGEKWDKTSDLDRFNAVIALLKDYISSHWLTTKERYRQNGSRQVYYFSIEFLLGRLLGSSLLNLGLQEVCREALEELGIDLSALRNLEEDPGLGNGGLGRLAACYLDSMAAMGLPGHGCGIRYRYGLFEQRFIDGYQHEYPDNWLADGFHWEVRRSDETVEVRFGGSIRVQTNGKTEYIHENYEPVLAVPYDVPVIGFQNDTVNTLRLWSAEAQLSDLAYSDPSRKDCHQAIHQSREVEAISNTLYPDDSTYEGRRLRLKQQYFMVSAGLQSIVRGLTKDHCHLRELPDKVAVHINDTHPALAVPELMRILMDEEGLTWDEAWELTSRTVSYTNHTVLPEALEKWPLELFRELLPRIYMIVQEINEQFCRKLWDRYPDQWKLIQDMAIMADGQVHMAHLAIVGSYSVNGVAAIHTELLKKQVMQNFYRFQPEKFNNKTNGITHRRWLMQSNPLLGDLINDTIGSAWIQFPCDLAKLAKHATDTSFQHHLHRVKLQNKVMLAKFIKEKHNISIDINSIFDTQIKRIHAYKRQLLNVLHIMDLYNRLKANPGLEIVPRTFIFAGKTAVGYASAKRTIKLINTVAELINHDAAIRDKIKVVFLENYNVSLAELIIPATDVSEQIPTASYEASGTGNMKLIMNGAVTIGTLDGANIEIRNAVGEANIITFGLTTQEVLDYYRYGGYNPWDVYQQDSRVKTVMDQLVNGFFPVDTNEFRLHFDFLLNEGDRFFVLKDFAAYADAQRRVEEKYRDKAVWLKMSALNIAYSGIFSGDRTFSEYSQDIWKIRGNIPVKCSCTAQERIGLAASECKWGTGEAYSDSQLH